MSKPRFREYCVKCGKEYPSTNFWTKCDCGGMIDIDYDMRQVRIHDNEKEILLRYRDLLPIANPENLIPIGAGNTPTLHAQRLGKHLGLENLYLKDETKNPTGTTKDRPACVVLSYFKERGVRHFTSSATGNSSTAFALACIANPPFEHSIFVGERWLTRLTFQAHPRIHVWVLKNARVVEAISYSRQWERENSIPAEGGFFNLGRREGLKMAYMEAVDHTGISFDWYFQGVSTAMGAFGTIKGAKQYLQLGRLSHLPKLGCIQEESCNPQVRAFKDGSATIQEPHIIPDPDGLADALLKGNPSDTYPYMHQVVTESGGLFESVTADEIRTARKEIFEYEGIPACSASSTTIAGIKKLLKLGKIGPKEKILANITGSDRDPSIHPRQYMIVTKNSAGVWQPQGEHVES